MKANKAFPNNEAETIDLYRLAQARLGWPIVHLQTACLDAIIAKNGYKLRAEFEYKARNFKAHGHDPDDCDIIICWLNNFPDAPVPVWELRDCAMAEASIIGRLLGGMVEKSLWLMIMQELQQMRKSNAQLRSEDSMRLAEATASISVLREKISYLYKQLLLSLGSLGLYMALLILFFYDLGLFS